MDKLKKINRRDIRIAESGIFASRNNLTRFTVDGHTQIMDMVNVSVFVLRLHVRAAVRLAAPHGLYP